MADKRTQPDNGRQHKANAGGALQRHLYRHMTDKTFSYIVASVIGLACGAAAALLKWLIKTIGIGVADLCSVDGFNWPLLISQLSGI